MSAIPLLPPDEGTYDLGSAAAPWRDAVLSGALTDASGNASTPAQIKTACTQAAAAIPASEKGAFSGVATLNASTRVPTAQVPRRYVLPAQALESCLLSDWAVAVNAPLSTDASNAGIIVRLFSDSAENGAGTQSILIPDDATALTITLHWRAVTAPSGTVGVVWKLYHRAQNNTVGSWANQTLTTASISNTNWQTTQQTISLSTLGITAGDTRQFELTRTPTATADTLAGNAALESIVLEFS